MNWISKKKRTEKNLWIRNGSFALESSKPNLGSITIAHSPTNIRLPHPTSRTRNPFIYSWFLNFCHGLKVIRFSLNSINNLNWELMLSDRKRWPATRIYCRNDFFKICLTTGKSIDQLRRVEGRTKSYREEAQYCSLGTRHIPILGKLFSTTYSGIYSASSLKEIFRVTLS